MIAFTIASLILMVTMLRVFGPDRKVCVRCGGWTKHKPGCDYSRKV